MAEREEYCYVSDLSDPSSPEAMYVSATRIRVNQKKIRKLNATKIYQYALDYEQGCNFPPILVNDHGDFYTISDGRHRFQAQLLAGFASIDVEVRPA